MEDKAVITLHGVTMTFPRPDSTGGQRHVHALDDISFSLNRNDLVVLAGANGSGKSLLMAIMSGLLRPTRGRIRRNGSVGLVFQNPDVQIIGETPLEDVAIGPRNLGMPQERIAPLCRQALEQAGLLEKAGFPSRSLSGGEKRRLATAGILAMDRELIIFDEPFANLDYPGVQQTNALISQLHQEGKTLLVLTHEIEKCLGLANRLMVLHGGRLVFDGSPWEGLCQNLEAWAIRNPLQTYTTLEDLVWR